MKNIDKLKKELKKYQIIKLITIPLPIICFAIIGIYPYITALATACVIIGIISIILAIKSNTKTQELQHQIKEIETITLAIEDSKKDKAKE